MNENEKNQEKKKRKKSDIIIIIIAAVILVCSCVYIGYYIYSQNVAEAEGEKLTTSAPDSSLVQNTLGENPVDFESLKAQNDEIYGWIKIENTNVDYPIVQSRKSDDFYLKHSAADKKWLESGAIYTQSMNKLDFSDPITLVYGHNGYKQTMFTTLHKFEKSDFFNENEYFNIYLEGRILTYQVISAFKYDDRHIMNSFDFSNSESLKEFQKTVTNPVSAVKNVRESLDVPIDENSKIVVLSTCITGQKSNRFLVCGVLVKDEKTK